MNRSRTRAGTWVNTSGLVPQHLHGQPDPLVIGGWAWGTRHNRGPRAGRAPAHSRLSNGYKDKFPSPEGECTTCASATAPDLGGLGTISSHQNVSLRTALGGVSKDRGWRRVKIKVSLEDSAFSRLLRKTARVKLNG